MVFVLFFVFVIKHCLITTLTPWTSLHNARWHIDLLWPVSCEASVLTRQICVSMIKQGMGRGHIFKDHVWFLHDFYIMDLTLRTMDLNSFLRCTQLNAPCTGLWQGDLQERMRRCFGLFFSTAVMTHRAPSPMWGLPASSTVGPFFFFFFCQPSLTPAGVLSFHPNPMTSLFHSLLESFC